MSPQSIGWKPGPHYGDIEEMAPSEMGPGRRWVVLEALSSLGRAVALGTSLRQIL